MLRHRNVTTSTASTATAEADSGNFCLVLTHFDPSLGQAQTIEQLTLDEAMTRLQKRVITRIGEAGR